MNSSILIYMGLGGGGGDFYWNFSLQLAIESAIEVAANFAN